MRKENLLPFGLACTLILASCGANSLVESKVSSETTVSTSEGTSNTITSATSETSITSETTSSTTSEESSTSETSTTSEISTTTSSKKNVKVFLAGDSTVKTYDDKQYIGGWGQYLDLFTDENVEVINCAQGGRSSRSFINEGRLYNIEGDNYSFTQNDGKSIEDSISAGDFLFIQFGHNDDDTKMASNPTSNYTTVYDRMVPLGDPDASGIYPTTAATRVATTHLPDLYTKYASDSNKTSALAEIAKYGDTYYAYDSNGTYKWYLKQYIDFAREKGAIPVLVTPVSRVKFSGDEIIGGPGLHGENFAYVQAVRQLASEEDCLLVDLFAKTKSMLETATSQYANYLMALKPNDLTGTWPSGYDTTYGNAALGYTGIEATHYNKYGAYLTAAYVAETILLNKDEKHNNGTEYYSFADNVSTKPSSYINPSNLMAKSKINALEASYTLMNVTDPTRTYPDPQKVIDEINTLVATTLTNDNYLAQKEAASAVEDLYNALNVDDRTSVTNYSLLSEYLTTISAFENANRKAASKTVVFDPSTLTVGDYADTTTAGDFTLVGGSNFKVMANESSFTINGQTITVSNLLSVGGSAKFGTSRYVEFSTSSKCTITVVAKSTGSSDRTLNMVAKGSTNAITSFAAAQSLTITTYDITDAGTYQIGSAGSGIYIAYILIEYFED